MKPILSVSDFYVQILHWQQKLLELKRQIAEIQPQQHSGFHTQQFQSNTT
ncbi:hypothetical protein VCRLGP107_170237 [Vibrio crassostreae]|nr:hypothetical protein VCRLGP107_170237 [Vibrio crassostreae]